METTERTPSSTPADLVKAGGGGRQSRRDVWRLAGTIGEPLGLSGTALRTFFFGAVAMAALVGAVNIVNVQTILHEQPQLGFAGPAVWEASSWTTFNLFIWIPWLALLRAPLGGHPRWRVALVHSVAAILFSFFHVSGFLLLRELVYAAFGQTYRVGALVTQFRYELGKDVFGYLFSVLAFAIAGFIVQKSAISSVRKHNTVYSIRDGARIMRVPMAEILAISSAGNYVEFVLRDGRKPLMRSALAAIELELAPHGFVRVHRSWLVNPTQMTALKPDGSGDYTVELGDLQVPLSRRFPEALARLKSS